MTSNAKLLLPFNVLLLDIDGVQTDGRLYYSSDGTQSKVFHAHDGVAIKRIIDHGVTVAMISNTKSHQIVHDRCATLGITTYYSGDDHKLSIVTKWLESYSWKLEKIAYIGDDINDLPVLSAVGISACPADAVPQVRNVCSIKLSTRGGSGVVREFVDLFLPQYSN